LNEWNSKPTIHVFRIVATNKKNDVYSLPIVLSTEIILN